MGSAVECERCHGPLTEDAKLAADGTLVCARCAAQEAEPGEASRPLRPPRPHLAWLRPGIFRRHGMLISLLLGAAALVGVPFALYALAVVPAVTLEWVALAYALLIGVSTWAGIVRATVDVHQHQQDAEYAPDADLVGPDDPARARRLA